MTPQEQSQYNQYNSISNQVIGKTPFGQFYGLMRGAATLGEGALKHKVCFNEDGSEVKVYNTRTNRLLGAFMRPTHEYVQEYLAKKSYGEAFLASLGVYGQMKAVKNAERATCIEVIPNDIIAEQNRRDKEESDKKQSEIDSLKRKLEKVGEDRFYKNSRFYIVSGSLILGIGLTLLIIKKWKT
jgi:hypothetical protein